MPLKPGGWGAGGYTVDVEEREEGEKAVAFTIWAAVPGQITGFTGFALEDVCEDVLVAEHDAFGVTSGSGRVD